MPHYLRHYVAGGLYFFTFNLHDRRRHDLVRHIECFRAAYQETVQYLPFTALAMTVLPDHVHLVMQLPEGERNFSLRLQTLKYNFSKRLPEKQVWQNRFWEHWIRDEQDLHNHICYTYYNPVKHGYVRNVRDWPYSTFHRDVRLGLFEAGWGEGLPDTLVNLYRE